MDGEPIEMCSAVGPSSLNDAQLHVQRAVGPSSLFYCLASTNSGGTSPLLCLARGPPFIKNPDTSAPTKESYGPHDGWLTVDLSAPVTRQ